MSIFCIVRKSFFTLLELLVVLLIISLGIALTGVKIHEAYTEQRFQSDAHKVLSQLALAQDLMLILDADVQIKFSHDPDTKQVVCWLEIEKPLEKGWTHILEHKLLLPSIGYYEFKRRHKNPLTLEFTLGGMSKGMLVLFEGKQDSHRSDKRQFTIELTGYPIPFGGQRKTIKKQNKTALSQILYPNEVNEALHSEKDQEKPS